jgi:EpsD family peptidyl-prolyl cis-trans isomerase
MPTPHVRQEPRQMRLLIARTCRVPYWGAVAGCLALSAHAALPTSATPAATPAANPIVATVDGEPITLQTVQAMAWRMAQLRPKEPPATQAQALEQLIDLKLQARQAQLQGVDTLPIVSEILAITRMDVLAKGLNDVKRQLQEPPTEAQIKDYYERSPDLFSKRKVFALQELMVEKSPWPDAELQRQVNKAPTMKALTSALEQAGGTYKINSVTQPAENLPLDALPEIASAPEGKPQWRRSPGAAASIYVVMATRSQAKTMDEAAPLIRIFLSNKGWMDESAHMVSDLRQKARIERMPLPSPNGDFTLGQ